MNKLFDVHVEFIRNLGYDDLNSWCQDCNNVYIGRKGIVFIKDSSDKKVRFPTNNSIWANPFKSKHHSSTKECLILYHNYILEKIHRENLWDELLKLKGKNLGCWCVGSNKRFYTSDSTNWICHGEVLMYIIKYYICEPLPTLNKKWTDEHDIKLINENIVKPTNIIAENEIIEIEVKPRAKKYRIVKPKKLLVIEDHDS